MTEALNLRCYCKQCGNDLSLKIGPSERGNPFDEFVCNVCLHCLEAAEAKKIQKQTRHICGCGAWLKSKVVVRDMVPSDTVTFQVASCELCEEFESRNRAWHERDVMSAARRTSFIYGAIAVVVAICIYAAWVAAFVVN